jgi:hypothetical protein
MLHYTGMIEGTTLLDLLAASLYPEAIQMPTKSHLVGTKGVPTAGGVAQVVECLPRKCKALSSKPSIKKKKKKGAPINQEIPRNLRVVSKWS